MDSSSSDSDDSDLSLSGDEGMNCEDFLSLSSSFSSTDEDSSSSDDEIMSGSDRKRKRRHRQKRSDTLVSSEDSSSFNLIKVVLMMMFGISFLSSSALVDGGIGSGNYFRVAGLHTTRSRVINVNAREYQMLNWQSLIANSR